jgi:predicted aminopeptidase
VPARYNALFIAVAFLSLSGCQLSYIIKSAHNQFSMMTTRQPISELLKDEKLDSETKRKFELTEKVRRFAFEELKLKKTQNYATFIDLHRPYVSWVVHAAYKWELKNYLWSYPIVGDLPYKGYFSEAEAQAESKIMEDQGYDTFYRGVSAYSTLGWFTDSLLSSMLTYKDYDLVNTIIHELTHTTIFIKGNADFNERLAVFVGNKGTEIFYKHLEGPESATLQEVNLENEDDKMFSEFITTELNELKKWYHDNSGKNLTETDRQNRIDEIKSQFTNVLKPKLKTNSYSRFPNMKLNNARLGLYTTYMKDMNEFEALYVSVGSDLINFIKKIKELESSSDPEKDLKNLK